MSFKEGTYAEYVSAKEEWLAYCPKSLPLHEAGQVPLVSLTCWQVNMHKDHVSHTPSLCTFNDLQPPIVSMARGVYNCLPSVVLLTLHKGGPCMSGNMLMHTYVTALSCLLICLYTSINMQLAWNSAGHV